MHCNPGAASSKLGLPPEAIAQLAEDSDELYHETYRVPNNEREGVNVANMNPGFLCVKTRWERV